MNISIKNANLAQVYDLLFNLSLTRKKSRMRSRFCKLLQERYEEVQKEKEGLLKEHCHLDAEGQPKTKTVNGEKLFDVKDEQSYTEDLKELLNEEMVVEGGDSREMLLTVKQILAEQDKEWQGLEAQTYDYLCEQFQVDIDSNDEEGEGA